MTKVFEMVPGMKTTPARATAMAGTKRRDDSLPLATKASVTRPPTTALPPAVEGMYEKVDRVQFGAGARRYIS